MSDFARQQSEFQRGILTGEDGILAEILDSPKEKRETLLASTAMPTAHGWSKPCATITSCCTAISAMRPSTR